MCFLSLQDLDVFISPSDRILWNECDWVELKAAFLCDAEIISLLNKKSGAKKIAENPGLQAYLANRGGIKWHFLPAHIRGHWSLVVIYSEATFQGDGWESDA